MTEIADHWERLVAVAMLGTDRRNPPDAPPPIADVVDDTVAADPSERMLTQVAATVAVRRAGVRPAPPVGRLLGPEPDTRPVIPSVAVDRWYGIVARWPVLEDEWMITVADRGWRLAPEMVPDALRRHRTDTTRRARVVVAAGPIAEWLASSLPDLDASIDPTLDAVALATLPDLPIPAELRRLLDQSGTSAGRMLAAAIGSGQLAHAHRAVLVNLLARVRPDALATIGDALDPLDSDPLAASLVDVATTRRAMLAELR